MFEIIELLVLIVYITVSYLLIRIYIEDVAETILRDINRIDSHTWSALVELNKIREELKAIRSIMEEFKIARSVIYEYFDSIKGIKEQLKTILEKITS